MMSWHIWMMRSTIRAATPACIPWSTEWTMGLAAKKEYQTDTMERMMSGGSREPRQLMRRPPHPAVRYPARADRLMAMAPGVDWEMADMSNSSSSEK